MPSRHPNTPLQALLVAAMIVPTLVFVASLPWLKQQPQGVAYLAAGVTAIVVIAAGLGFSVLHERRQDEWQRSGAGVSTKWGMAIGTCLMGGLLVAPPFQAAVVSLVSSVAAEGAGREYTMVILAFTLGFGSVVLMQGLCTIAAFALWSRRMSRPAKDAA